MGASDEEDDDTHYCLKCGRTMRGLETYVAHRKAKCRPGLEKEVEAQDFFSSLNLQSSGTGGGKSQAPGAVVAASDWGPPSPAYTGGKWRPGHTAVIHHQQQQVDEVREEIPPPGHTGGKWKPQADIPEAPLVTREAPPPSHTRGKWGPSERPWGQLRKGLYWCGPCNRRLSSRVVYERHLRSELHFKRTNQWPRDEPQMSTRTRGRTKAILSSSLKVINRRYTKDKELNRRKKGGPMVCEACRCKVWPHLIGKHLVSHYHYRHRRPGWEHLVFENMASIVKHFPYQCGICKFYTNTMADFMDHWASEMHAQNDTKFEGVYWCNVCKVSCESAASMDYHLKGEPHRELVAVINRSVPVVVQKHYLLQCEVCSRGFRYNLELRKHARSWGHAQTTGTASDRHQETSACPDCDYRCSSLLSYQRHVRMKHGKEMHFCRKCDLKFDTVEEVRKHRLESKHREAGDTYVKRCVHCQHDFVGLAALRSHLLQDHPEERHRCLKCGAGFVLKQELSRHGKVEDCRPPEASGGGTTAASDGRPRRRCDRCDFGCGADWELLLHQAVSHGGGGGGRFPCPVCGRRFLKEALKNHVKTHTGEKGYVCNVCHARFSRRDVLSKHVSRLHEERTPAQDVLTEDFFPGRTKEYKCHQCSAAFYDKGALEKHIQRHDGKKFPCPVENCIFKGRSVAEVKAHERTHGSAREFHCADCQYSSKTKSQLLSHRKLQHTDRRLQACPHCDFTTKNSSHLKRHVRLHTGQKPYKCPHCSFSCSLLENLRKHALTSKLHPDMRLYSCPECDVSTNFAKELKSHLVVEHGFSAQAATSHLAGLHRASEGSSEVGVLQPVRPNKRKRQRREIEVEDEVAEDLPSLTFPGHHEEDVIFIEVDEGLQEVLYQAGESAFSLESYRPIS